MTFDEILSRVSASTARTVRYQVGLYVAGSISLDALRGTVQTVLDLAATQGANFGQISYAQYAEAIGGSLPERIADSSVTASHNHKRIIESSLDTIFGGDLSTLDGKLSRLALNLPVQAIQGAYGDALANDPKSAGWVRGLEPDACQLCVWWWREGGIWPKNHPMPTHSGCQCQQIPEFASEIMSTQKTRELGDETLAAQAKAYEEKRKVKGEETV